MVLLLVAVACAGGGSGDGDGDTSRSRACTVLERDEVAGFVGEPVGEGRPDTPGEGVEDTCRWGDADPAAPGHVLSLTLAPAGSVERAAPGPGDRAYPLPGLGEGAQGFQQAGGGVRVVFAVHDLRADLVYDVVPLDALEADAVDRLARLAGRVRDRLATLR